KKYPPDFHKVNRYAPCWRNFPVWLHPSQKWPLCLLSIRAPSPLWYASSIWTNWQQRQRILEMKSHAEDCTSSCTHLNRQFAGPKGEENEMPQLLRAVGFLALFLCDGFTAGCPSWVRDESVRETTPALPA